MLICRQKICGVLARKGSSGTCLPWLEPCKPACRQGRSSEGDLQPRCWDFLQRHGELGAPYSLHSLGFGAQHVLPLVQPPPPSLLGRTQLGDVLCSSSTRAAAPSMPLPCPQPPLQAHSPLLPVQSLCAGRFVGLQPQKEALLLSSKNIVNKRHTIANIQIPLPLKSIGQDLFPAKCCCELEVVSILTTCQLINKVSIVGSY